jgi:hypothetical protein
MGEKEMREPDQMSLRYAGIIKKGARSDDGLSSQYLMGLSGEVFFGQHLRSLHCLELFEEEDGELIVRTFFFLDLLKEIAFLAIVVLFREESLFLPSTHGSCDDPAGSAGIHSTMRAVELFFDRRRTDAELLANAAGFATAVHGFPAVLFPHNKYSPFPIICVV